MGGRLHYPDAPPADVVDVLHGVKVPDPYRWLEDAETTDTRAWTDAQDALASDHLESLEGREAIRERVGELARVGFVSAPQVRGERLFFRRREGHQEHGVLWVREPDGTERVLIDPAGIDPELTTTLDFAQPSVEGDRLAYGLSVGGDEESTLHVMDVDTGEDLGVRIDRVRYTSVGWLPGGERFYYVRRLPSDEVPEGEEQYHRRVYLHTIGSDADADDVEIFGADRDPRSYHSAGVSPDGRWLLVTTQIGTDRRNDLYIADLHGSGELRPVAEGEDAHVYGSIRAGRLYLRTNLDAPRWRIAVADPERPHEWMDLVVGADEVIEGFAVTTEGLVVASSSHATGRLAVHDVESGEKLRDLELPTTGSVWVMGPPEVSDEAYVMFQSFTVPSQVYRWRAGADTLELWAEAPGSFDPEGLDVSQIFVTSKDGTRVPMFVVRRADVAADGTAPGILTGYGGFNNSLTPLFMTSAVAAAEHGCVVAVANLRGGAEYGEDWHRAGMLGNKQNVFDDFIAAAEHLVEQGYVAPGRLAIMGGSNGGLLVGAALTQRPDLFRAVVCSAPLLDMLRYERFGLGSTWNVEYGSADDPEAFGWLHAYSPYHRVQDGTDYPAVLFKTYESDTRVDPFHARKMCARLQAATSSERPILLRRETKAGHAGKAVSRVVDDQTDTLAFLFSELGVDAG